MSSLAGLGDKPALPVRAQALGQGRPHCSSSAEEVAADLPVSLAQQVPLLPEEAYRLSASSRSQWRRKEDKEGFKKKVTKRKTVISNPNLVLPWLC